MIDKEQVIKKLIKNIEWNLRAYSMSGQIRMPSEYPFRNELSDFSRL